VRNCRWGLVHSRASVVLRARGFVGVDEVLFQVLAESVGRYLDAVDRLAGAQGTAARVELRRMSAAWRSLLGMHRPAGTRHRCTGCADRTGMCSVWRVASAYFVRKLRA
jgi:hypothetical protein